MAVRLGRNLGTVLSSGWAEEGEERDLLICLARTNNCGAFWDVGANYGLLDPACDWPIIEVVASTIDAESVRLGRPDVIKIDVEGAELAVLRGGKLTLEAHIPIILLECTHRQEDVRRFLEELGYEIRDPKTPANRAAGPGMPCMALALDPRRHVLSEAGP